jgi:IS5 family transposase
MRPRERRDGGQGDLLRSRLDQIIDMRHPLVALAHKVDWAFVEQTFGEAYTDGPGQPPLPTRLMAGLIILKYTHDLSDEVLCERWVENPYYQFFCGEEFFQHKLVLDRSSLSRWRARMGEEKIRALLQESLSIAVKTDAVKPAQLSEVIIDTTVQPKNVMFPTDARLLNRAREILVRLAGKHGVALRQSYARVGKFALIKHQRYAHAKQFKRANRALKTLRTYLGRVIRDITRKIDGDAWLKEVIFGPLLLRARRVRDQKQHQRGPKVYSLHAPEVECIGKGKARSRLEFGCKVSLATTNRPAPGGQFVLGARTLPGNPFDGHTLADQIAQTERLTGVPVERAYVDRGYRGHDADKQRVFVSGQKRGVTPTIRREIRRRAGIEPVIGHMKEDGHLGRNFLAGATGDAINLILTAAGHNLRLLRAWLSRLFAFLLSILAISAPAPPLPSAQLAAR